MSDTIECRTCTTAFDPGDLNAVLFHEHLGLAESVDADSVKPGVRVDQDASTELHPRLTGLNPRQALGRIRLLAATRHQSKTFVFADALLVLSTIESICADLLKPPESAPCPSKACTVCKVEFQFNPLLADHMCSGCDADLCPSCECCTAP